MMSNPGVLICDKCKKEFFLNTTEIKESAIRIGDEDLVLVFFTCPECNEIYRVSLKDKRYEELVEDIEKTKRRVRKLHGSDCNELAKTLNSMLLKKVERLRAHTTKLNKKFNGTFTFVVSENNQEEKTIKYLP